MNARKTLTTILAITILLAICPAAQAVTETFAAVGETGNWSDGTMWDRGYAPDGDDDIGMDGLWTRTITYDAAAIGGANSITKVRLGTLKLDKTLTVAGNVNIIRDGTLDLSSGAGINVGGNLFFGDTTGNAKLINGGPINVTGQLTINYTGSTITLDGDDTMGSLYVRMSPLAIAGDVTTPGDLSMPRQASLTFQNASHLTVANATIGGEPVYSSSVYGYAGATLEATGNLSLVNTDSELKMVQAASDTSGLSLIVGGTTNFGTGEINLTFDDDTVGGALTGDPANFDWAFRWQGDHEALLESLVGTRLLVNTGAAAVTFDGADNILFASDGYTYVGFVPAAVPEPATMSLLALGAAGMLARRRRR